MNNRNQCINVCKGIACELVVINYFYGTGTLGRVEYAISHIGVPFFFLVSGFFLYDKQGGLSLRRLFKKVQHIIYLFVIHFSLYFIDNCFQKYVLNGNNMTLSSLFRDLGGILSCSALKSMVIWSTSLIGKGQWFLIALIEAYIFFLVLVLFRMEKFIAKYGHIIAVALFAIHIPVRMVLIKYGILSVGEMLLSTSASVRNVWFNALPFMLLGISIRNGKLKVSGSKKLIYIGGIALAISVFESFLINRIMAPENVSCVLYFGTIVAVVSFFIYSVYTPQGINNHLLEYIGDKLSMIIYFIHPLVGFYILRVDLWKNLILKNLLPFIVMIITTWISYVIYKLFNKIKLIRKALLCNKNLY